MAPAIRPMEKPSGQDVPPLGRRWEETRHLRNAAVRGEASPEEIIEYSEVEEEDRKFHPLLFQAHGIIIGISLMTILIFLVGWFVYPRFEIDPTAPTSVSAPDDNSLGGR